MGCTGVLRRDPRLVFFLLLESVRSWWCHQSCLLLAAVGGVQPHGSCHPSTIIRLQGFSSRSPAAVPRRWSPKRMTTRLVAGRSMPGCGLSPTLSFKDVHHPHCGGRRVEPGPYPSFGLVTRFFLQHSEEKGVHQPFGRGELWCRLRRRLLPSGRTGVRTRRRTPRRWQRRSWTVLSSLLLVKTRARTPSCVLRQQPPTGAEVVAAAGEAISCRGGCLRW
jgi:hypothetical protein